MVPHRLMTTVVLGTLIWAGLALPASAAESVTAVGPSSTQLVEHPRSYDGAEIVFVGEAIGEAMVRGDEAWVHLNDDAYMLHNVEEGAPLEGFNSGQAVWLPATEAGKIRYFGDHQHQGDIVRVRGVFHAACLEHGGDMDIHASSLEIVRRGWVVHDPVQRTKLVWALALAPLALALYAVDRWGTTGLGGRRRARR